MEKKALKSAVNRRRWLNSAFLSYPAEYTLTPCPIFRDHLSMVGADLKVIWEMSD